MKITSFEISTPSDTTLVALIMAVPVAPRLSLYFCRYPTPKSTCLLAKSTSTKYFVVVGRSGPRTAYLYLAPKRPPPCPPPSHPQKGARRLAPAQPPPKAHRHRQGGPRKNWSMPRPKARTWTLETRGQANVLVHLLTCSAGKLLRMPACMAACVAVRGAAAAGHANGLQGPHHGALANGEHSPKESRARKSHHQMSGKGQKEGEEEPPPSTNPIIRAFVAVTDILNLTAVQFLLYLCFVFVFQMVAEALRIPHEYFFDKFIADTFIDNHFDSSHNTFLSIRRSADIWEWGNNVLWPGIFGNLGPCTSDVGY